MAITVRRAIATVLFGIVGVMALKALLTPRAEPIEYLTGALAFATAVYGWFTSETVIELQASRDAGIKPMLIPYLELLDPRQAHMYWGIKNVGLGPAIAVDVTLSPSKLLASRYRSPIISPGEVSYVSSRMNRSGNDVIGPNEFDPEAPALRLVGTCRDVAGRVHRVDISVDLVHRWEHGLPAATVKLLADEAAEAGIAPP